MPQVQLPDGNLLDVPDNATPEQLTAIKTKLASLQPSTWDKVKSYGADALRGAGRGLAAIVEGAAPASVLGPIGGQAIGVNNSAITQSVDQALPTPQGDSTGRKYARAAIEGVTGAAATGGVSPAVLAAGVGGGVAGEAAEHLAPGNPITKAAASVVGGVGAGGVTALASRIRPQSAAVAREAMEGLTEQELQAAAAYKQQMAATGVDIDLAQALQATKGNAGNLESLRNHVASRSQGNATQATLRNQPAQLGVNAGLTVEGMAGRNFGAQQNANNVQEAASGAIAQAKKARSDAVAELYAKAGNLPAGSQDDLVAIASKYLNEPGASEVMKTKAKDFMVKVTGRNADMDSAVTAAERSLANAESPTSRTAARQELAALRKVQLEAQKSDLHAADVNQWISELAGPYQGGTPLKISHPTEAGQVRKLAGDLNNRFQQLSPEVAAAEAEFGRISKETVNPLKQGPVGTINQPAGYNDQTAAMVTKFEGLLNKGTDPTSKVSDIATVGKELAKVNPDAFQDAFKGWLSRKVQGAMEVPIGGNAPNNPDMAAKLHKALFDDALQWQGMKDAVGQIAKQNKQDPAEVIRGLESLRQLSTAMKSRPGAVGGVSPEDLRDLGGNSSLATATKMIGMIPFSHAASKMENLTLGKTLSQLDTILTSPDGVNMLIKLGKVPVMSAKAKVILGTMGSVAGNPPALSPDNPPL